jgi:hypothetical protein
MEFAVRFLETRCSRRVTSILGKTGGMIITLKHFDRAKGRLYAQLAEASL